jgi:hypothetical protein
MNVELEHGPTSTSSPTTPRLERMEEEAKPDSEQSQ